MMCGKSAERDKKVKITEIKTTMMHDPNGFVIQDATIPPIDPSATGRSQLFVHIHTDEGTIGLLWAEGVVAEIALFAFGAGLAARLGPKRLLAIGAAGAALRWTVTAQSTELAVLISVQWLHALSFGATHLAAMQFIARAVPNEMSATAQSLQAAVAVGAAMALSTMLAGWLFAADRGSAFTAMVGLAVAGGIASVALAAFWRGERLAPE